MDSVNKRLCNWLVSFRYPSGTFHVDPDWHVFSLPLHHPHMHTESEETEVGRGIGYLFSKINKYTF